MRGMGAVAVIVSMAWCGFSKCLLLKKRERVLASLLAMLELMKNEICSRKTPMKMILTRINAFEEPYVRAFSGQLVSDMDSLGERSFAELWCEAADRQFDILPEPALRALKTLGLSLGKYGAELQSCAIDNCVDTLKKEHEELKSRMQSDSRMYIGLYSGIGIITAVILI